MPFAHLDLAQLSKLQQQDPQLQIVDIRDAASFEQGHIPSSFNLSNDNLVDYIQQADLDAPLVVVCYHGISSQNAANYLSEQGFDHVYSLDGGFTSWQVVNL
ncbi:thiosulfate sulfurtransferase GlpE [Shewanella sp. NIFS-20-20]|uniref:thiosulfate sulfurtransferase GlpE n=1 Tax=Shewanella sp. NIFS-20-20 TaxID=2853806 RepID=UPI001C48C284|nr:thiosulfate sulfurtransferase GlpE [Shewanella sp. NIFS-20-20]MBV7316114.1 thiosulfate sulfurtransferase GlpE [Shewanella sp. NIFS-20-20]